MHLLAQNPFELTFRPITVEDLDEWYALVLRIFEAEKPVWHEQREDLQNALNSTKNDPRFDTVIGFDQQGVARAFARVSKNPEGEKAYLFGGVDPLWQRRGIGSALLGWQQAQAARRFESDGQSPVVVRKFADQSNLAELALCDSAGYSVVRYFAEMRRPLADPIPEIPLDEGLELKTFSSELSEQVRLAHNEAFADHWGSEPRDQESWGFLIDHPHMRADWSTVVIDTANGEIAGYQIANYDPEVLQTHGRNEGYTELLGVRRAYRGRRIAAVLLAEAMQRFSASGMDWAALDVDTENPTGAYGLYERLGYQPHNRSMAYDKEL
ncbi:GNAT family acetyltransferase [Psychromicrobium lacuslunae]|uniref:GNAT family acetyltransferase n=1 Tax=Psychromicrobium lacuslunae TaxID=1618207 RepID=A0A0D4C357_9MICC|nr:GNAT family acetyltransferase [Psychromicrobium lacuslunae]